MRESDLRLVPIGVRQTRHLHRNHTPVCLNRDSSDYPRDQSIAHVADEPAVAAAKPEVLREIIGTVSHFLVAEAIW